MNSDVITILSHSVTSLRDSKSPTNIFINTLLSCLSWNILGQIIFSRPYNEVRAMRFYNVYPRNILQWINCACVSLLKESEDHFPKKQPSHKLRINMDSTPQKQYKILKRATLLNYLTALPASLSGLPGAWRQTLAIISSKLDFGIGILKCKRIHCDSSLKHREIGSGKENNGLLGFEK